MDLMEWKASEEVIEERRAICASCNKYRSFTNTCSECGCVIALKTTVKIFECPLKKWLQVN